MTKNKNNIKMVKNKTNILLIAPHGVNGPGEKNDDNWTDIFDFKSVCIRLPSGSVIAEQFDIHGRL